MFGWNLLPWISPCNVQLHHWHHVYFENSFVRNGLELPLGNGTNIQVLLTIKEFITW
jgi:hypothetical protein